jgi:Acyltransferase family.
MVTFESSERRGESTWSFIKSRLVRLLKPSLVFLGVWLVVQTVLHLADVGAPAGITLWADTKMLRGMLPPAATIPFGPLWFLAVYLVIVCIAPLTVRLHRRFGLWVPAVMVVATVVIDVIGFGSGHFGLRYLNIAPVLLLPHQLGHFYADGSLVRQKRRVFAAMTAIGPTVCFMLGGISAIGIAMLLRPAISRRLQRPRLWKKVIVLNATERSPFDVADYRQIRYAADDLASAEESLTRFVQSGLGIEPNR